MYSSLHFPSENSVEGVPSSWTKTIDGKLYCHWPNAKPDKISCMIKKGVAVSDKYTWKLFPCVLKNTSETYDEMKRNIKMIELAVTTDVNSSNSDSNSMEPSSSEDELPEPPERLTLKNKIVVSESSSSEEVDAVQPKKKKLCTVDEADQVKKRKYSMKANQTFTFEKEIPKTFT